MSHDHATMVTVMYRQAHRPIYIYMSTSVHEEKTKKTKNLTNMKRNKEQEALLLLILSRRRKQRLRQKKRRIWVHEILQKRKELGEYHTLTAIDVCSYWRNSDGGIYVNSLLGKALEEKKLNVPENKCLPDAPELGPMPHVIVADAAFPFKTYIMRPYAGRNLADAERIFNYRLSKARRISENAFGILAARWRVYQRRIQLHPINTEKMIKATCVLHNYLQKTSPDAEQCDPIRETNGEADNDRPTLQNLPRRGNRGTNQATETRDNFKNYFKSLAGEVSWQGTSCFCVPR